MGETRECRESYGGGEIEIRTYDSDWPRMFGLECARIEAALGDLVTAIEHIGSTAVPGLCAKPIIDLLVGIPDFARDRSTCREPLRAHGYAYMGEYEAWLPDEMLFRKVGRDGRWTHHAHVTEHDGPVWTDYLMLRDYLRSHAEAAHAYANLKLSLAARYRCDIAGYREAKRPFVEQLKKEARRTRLDALALKPR